MSLVPWETPIISPLRLFAPFIHCLSIISASFSSPPPPISSTHSHPLPQRPSALLTLSLRLSLSLSQALSLPPSLPLSPSLSPSLSRPLSPLWRLWSTVVSSLSHAILDAILECRVNFGVRNPQGWSTSPCSIPLLHSWGFHTPKSAPFLYIYIYMYICIHIYIYISLLHSWVFLRDLLHLGDFTLRSSHGTDP